MVENLMGLKDTGRMVLTSHGEYAVYLFDVK